MVYHNNIHGISSFLRQVFGLLVGLAVDRGLIDLMGYI